MGRENENISRKTASHVHPVQKQATEQTSPGHPLLRLQRAVGNQNVQRLIRSPFIQAKLQVSAPEDPSELEADQVSDSVMRMSDPTVSRQALVQPLSSQTLAQRETDQADEEDKIVAPKSKSHIPVAVREDEDEEEQPVQRVCDECEDEMSVQRACDECEETMVHRENSEHDNEAIPRNHENGLSRATEHSRYAVQSSAATGFSRFVQYVTESSSPASTPSHKAASRMASIPEYAARAVAGRGARLPYLETIQPAFGRHDIRGIEVHVGGGAGEAARRIGARAYTTGTKVAFNGAPDLHTVAHEAAHVVQQRRGVQLAGGVGRSGDVYERHADAVADRVVRRESAEDLLDTMAGEPFPNVQRSPAQDVVQRDDDTVTFMTMPDFVDTLGIPKETVPPGAETNPEFLEALVDAQPGSSISQLEETVGVPDEVAASLPEGRVSEVSSDEMLGFVGPGDRKSDPSMGPAQGVMRGATEGAMEPLKVRGYRAAGPNAIGIVAFPQSRVVRLIGTTVTGKTPQLGKGPWLPESRIVFGHTAVYVRVDGVVKLMRSYAPESLIDATLHIRQVASGSGPGVAAQIIDHTGRPFPPGGKMFEIASGRSVEYAVPKDMALKFMDQLPQGGPLPGKFYTAQPHIANQFGPDTRVCASRNCVHWAVDEAEKFLGAKIGPGGSSLVDQPNPNAARQSATIDYLKKGGGSVTLPTGETVTPVRGEMPTHLKVLKVGGRIFTVYTVYQSAKRLYNAPFEEWFTVLGEELGLHAGGFFGARAGVAGCVALGSATGGLGLLICGIGGALGGGWVGEKIGGFAGNFITAVIFAPIIGMELTAWSLVKFMEAAEVLGNILGVPFRAMFAGLVGNRERLNVDNWDLRYFPAEMASDVRLVGAAVWQELAPLNADDLLGRIMNPLSSYAVPSDAVQRIATVLTRMEQQAAISVQARTAAEILAMTPLDLIRMLETWKLSFVQEPDYVGGLFTGRWDNEQSLVVHLGPLIRERAVINPYNWDVSDVPAVNFEDVDDSIDLGDAISSVGGYVWDDLGKLDEAGLRSEIGKPLKSHNVPEELLDDVADGGSQVATAKSTQGVTYDLEPATFFQLSPAQFVQHLRELGIPLKFIKEPTEIEKLALQWVRRGFKPW